MVANRPLWDDGEEKNFVILRDLCDFVVKGLLNRRILTFFKKLRWEEKMVPSRRLELPRPYEHKYLKLARLPIPP